LAIKKEFNGKDNVKGSGQRYALERSGYKNVGRIWGSAGYGDSRRQLLVNTVRNYDQWKQVDAGKLHTEIERLNFYEKFSLMKNAALDLI